MFRDCEHKNSYLDYDGYNKSKSKFDYQCTGCKKRGKHKNKLYWECQDCKAIFCEKCQLTKFCLEKHILKYNFSCVDSVFEGTHYNCQKCKRKRNHRDGVWLCQDAICKKNEHAVCPLCWGKGEQKHQNRFFKNIKKR